MLVELLVRLMQQLEMLLVTFIQLVKVQHEHKISLIVIFKSVCQIRNISVQLKI